ncbi:MAG: hypothetical protein MUF59_04220 [Candidatus Krumholzibacteria bacterium]|jgi:hypothetical protein|nr:hypothetical protein [Candidatus Krumholzibacteria bacterium]
MTIRLVSLLLSFSILLAPSVSRSGGFELLSRSLFQGTPREALIAGGNIVLASGGALAVLGDPSDPGAFTFVPLDGQPYDIETKGTVVYAAAWEKGIVTVDLADPAKPVVYNSFSMPRITHLCACGDLLVAADIGKGVVTFDLSDPLNPAPTPFEGIKVRPLSLLADDGTVVIVESGGAAVYSAGEGGALDLRSRIEAKAGKGRSYLHRKILYIPAGGSFERFDISDPGSPLKLDPLPIAGAAALAFNEDRGLALTGGGKIIPFDMQGGGGGRRAADAGGGSNRSSRGPAVSGNPLRADYGRVAAGERPSPKRNIVDKLTGRDKSGFFPGSSIAISEGLLVCVDEKEGFWIYDLRAGDASCTGKVAAKGYAIDLVAEDGYVYLANGADGLRVGKAGETGSIEWIGHLQTSMARDVALEGDVLYLADGNDGLKTVDIKDPANPRLLGRSASPFFLSAVVAEGDRAFVAGGLGGTEIVDCSDPAKPRLVWREKFSEVRGIFADREYFYFADGFKGFRIYAHGGTAPRLVSSTRTPGWNCDVFAGGGLLYLAIGGDGLAVADIGDRSKPVMLGSVSVGSIAREIHVEGRTVFVASQTNGINAIDVSDPGNPAIAANHPSVDDGRGVFADGRFVYLASGSGGLYIFRYNVK